MINKEPITVNAPLKTAENCKTLRQVARVRLYIAKSTPNSIRAEQNLLAALDKSDDECGSFELEIIDVFAHPKRAITDGVMVTPTLVGIRANGRSTMVGDLGDSAKLKLLLEGLRGAAIP